MIFNQQIPGAIQSKGKPKERKEVSSGIPPV